MTTDTLLMPDASLDDLDGIMDLVRAVQWPHRRGDIEMLIRLGAGRVVVGDRDEILGGALWWAFEPAAARLGMVIVSPDAQGRGIGRRLVEQVLADTDGRSVKLLATEAGKPLYDTLGFLSVGACRQHQGPYTSEPAGDPAIRLATTPDLPEILALDAPVFGARREPALRALMEAGKAVVLIDAGAVTGYAMERKFGRGSVVGPIVARNDDDAIRLFRALARPGFVRVDIPAEAEALGNHLTSCGLESLGADSPVMVRGAWPDPTGPCRVFGLASHALG